MYQYLVYGFSLQQLSQLNLLTDNKKLYILCTLVKTVHFFCFYLRNVKLCVLNSTIKKAEQTWTFEKSHNFEQTWTFEKSQNFEQTWTFENRQNFEQTWTFENRQKFENTVFI